jgi:hypothetical protein
MFPARGNKPKPNKAKNKMTKTINIKNRLESCQEINAKGYTFKGKAPAASCPKCGGWTSQGGMSHHYGSTSLEMGRLGCKVACYPIDPATEKKLVKTFDSFSN